MPKGFRRDAARRDLIEHFLYLADEAGLATAERFLAQAEASFQQLAEHPKMGAPLTLRPPELAGLRKWRVSDFAIVQACLVPATPGWAPRRGRPRG